MSPRMPMTAMVAPAPMPPAAALEGPDPEFPVAGSVVASDVSARQKSGSAPHLTHHSPTLVIARLRKDATKLSHDIAFSAPPNSGYAESSSLLSVPLRKRYLILNSSWAIWLMGGVEHARSRLGVAIVRLKYLSMSSDVSNVAVEKIEGSLIAATVLHRRKYCGKNYHSMVLMNDECEPKQQPLCGEESRE